MPEFLGSINAGNSVPVDLLTDTQGSIFYHNGTGWVGLAPGTAGYRLKTNGAAANPEWVINTPESHAHGSITNAGAIGSTSGLPVKTGASGVLEVGAFGTGSGHFAAGDHKHTIVEINTQVGTSYTLVLGDAGKLVTMDNGGASTWTIPPNADVEFPTGTEIAGLQLGAGGVTITPGSGVTLLNGGGGLVTAAVNTSWDVVKLATNTWLVVMGGAPTSAPGDFGIACSDEATAITTGTSKVTFRMPYAMTLTAVRASVGTAPTGADIIIDINESGSTILSTKLRIDATEKTSTTTATPAVISDTSLADDAEITIDFDQVGSTIAGAGVKVWFIGNKT